MNDQTANRAFLWFTPGRFAVLLAVLIFATFPQVLLGLQTFVVRDYGFFAYPLAHFQQDCFWHGEIPFWDPYNNCGVPFLAQWNTMPLYPPSLIYLLLPLTWSLGFFCLLHLWFGGMGMYFLARKWAQNDFAAAFAGTAFCFSGMTLNLLMWPSHTATWCWMPWVILAVESSWRGGGRQLFLAAMAGAFQMLAGGPELIFFTWLILLALWIQHLVVNGSKGFWYFPLTVGLVTALVAVQLLPFLDLTAHSQRQAGYADLRWSMPGHGWVNFLVPMAFGRVLGEGIFFQKDQNWTSSYYLGMATLWLALLALWKGRDRRVYLLGAISAVAVVFALGPNTPIFPALRKMFPQFGFVTYPVKYLLLVVFAAPLLAAFSLSRLQEGKIRKHAAVVGSALLLVLAAALVWLGSIPFLPQDMHAVMSNGFSRLLFLGVTGAALLVLAKNPGTTIYRAVPLLLILIAWLDILTHEPRQNPVVPPNAFQLNLARENLAMNPQPDLGGSRAMIAPKFFLRLIQFALPDPMNDFLAKRLGYCANANLLDGVPKVDGFFSLMPRENDGMFSLLYATTNEFPRLEDFLGVSETTAPDEVYHWQPRKTFLPLVTAGQKPVFLGDAQTLHALTDSNFDGDSVVFLAPETKPLVDVTNQTDARVLNSKFEINSVSIQAQASAPSLVVVAQTYYHDWRASVDGRDVPLLRANYGYQALQIPPGRHNILLVYKDEAFEIGAVISAAAWLLCLFGLIWSKPARQLNEG
jgi:hypothetical protein